MATIKPKFQDEITNYVNEQKLAKVGKIEGHEHFFEKNNLVFAILLLCCVIAGLYNTIRVLMKKDK